MFQNVTFQNDVDKCFKTKHTVTMSAEIWSKVEVVAKTLGVPEATIKTWKHRENVPPARHKEFVIAAKKKNIPLTYEELNSIQ